MKKFKTIALLYIGVFSIISCSSEESNVSSIDLNPEAPKLISPANNSECFDGNIINDLETNILFDWSEASNTSSYILVINSLSSGEKREIKTQNHELNIRLKRGTPYSWQVKSILDERNGSAESETWKFYTEGLPNSNHPPFPASFKSPTNGSNIDSGVILLEWNALDIDNDIDYFEVFMGNSTSSLMKIGQTSSMNFEVSVISDEVYYWMISTFDEQGNSSDSQVFEFQTN